MLNDPIPGPDPMNDNGVMPTKEGILVVLEVAAMRTKDMLKSIQYEELLRAANENPRKRAVSR